MEPVLQLVPDTLQSVRARRAELRESMVALEAALAAPAPGRSEQWAQRVHVALVELDGDLRLHVALMEGPDGLHAQIVAEQPRLAIYSRRLADDHAGIDAMVAALLTMVESPQVDIDAVRHDGVELLGRLVRHRQAGADLVYQGYESDIGGQD